MVLLWGKSTQNLALRQTFCVARLLAKNVELTPKTQWQGLYRHHTRC